MALNGSSERKFCIRNENEVYYNTRQNKYHFSRVGVVKYGYVGSTRNYYAFLEPILLTMDDLNMVNQLCKEIECNLKMKKLLAIE